MGKKSKNAWDGLERHEITLGNEKFEIPVARLPELKIEKSPHGMWIKPNYSDWIKADLWELEEAVFLINDCQPRVPDYVSGEDGEPIRPKKPDYKFESEMSHHYKLAKRSISAGKLKLIDKKYVIPGDFVKWAISKGLNVCKEFMSLAFDTNQKPIKRQKSKGYMDKIIEKTYTELLKEKDKFTARDVWRLLNKFDTEETIINKNYIKLEYNNPKNGKIEKLTYKTLQNKFTILRKGKH